MTQPLLDNVVVLPEGRAVELHFTDHWLGALRMRDPIIGLERDVQTLAFTVDEEDGRPVSKVYYVTASRHASDFGPYLEDRSYTRYTWAIIVRGQQLLRAFTTIRLPRATREGAPPAA